MIVTGIFSTPIAETILDIDTKCVLEYVKSLPFENTDDGCCSYSSSKKIFNDHFFFDLKNQIKNCGDSYANQVLGFDTSLDFTFDIKTSWIIKMEPGNFVNSHYHGQSIFTGIVYLSVDPNGSNKLELKRPPIKNSFFDFKTINWNIHNCKAYFIKPEVNKLVFFPSEIAHYAHPNKSGETLYCLAFDFVPRGIIAKNTPSELILNW